MRFATFIAWGCGASMWLVVLLRVGKLLLINMICDGLALNKKAYCQ